MGLLSPRSGTFPLQPSLFWGALCILSSLSTNRAICFQSYSSKKLVRWLLQKFRGWSTGLSLDASFLSVHPSTEAIFSRNLSGFSSKSPLQPSSLSLPFTQASFGFHKYFGEMRRALNLESEHLVLDHLPQTHQTNDWTSASHVVSPLSNEDDDTCPVSLKALL